jgi:hypothetical protein
VTIQHVLIGLAAWTGIAVVMGLGMGNALRVCAQSDGTAPAMRAARQLKKTA